jgi:hypothetical protein
MMVLSRAATPGAGCLPSSWPCLLPAGASVEASPSSALPRERAAGTDALLRCTCTEPVNHVAQYPGRRTNCLGGLSAPARPRLAIAAIRGCGWRQPAVAARRCPADAWGQQIASFTTLLPWPRARRDGTAPHGSAVVQCFLRSVPFGKLPSHRTSALLHSRVFQAVFRQRMSGSQREPGWAITSGAAPRLAGPPRKRIAAYRRGAIRVRCGGYVWVTLVRRSHSNPPLSITTALFPADCPRASY